MAIEPVKIRNRSCLTDDERLLISKATDDLIMNIISQVNELVKKNLASNMKGKDIMEVALKISDAKSQSFGRIRNSYALGAQPKPKKILPGEVKK